MRRRYLLLFLMTVFSGVGLSQDLIVKLSYRKMERSKDSNRENYSFSVTDSLFTYAYSSRNRDGKTDIDSTILLSQDQIQTLNDHLESLKLSKKNNLFSDSVDGMVSITITGSIEKNEETFYFRISCGIEDNAEERDQAEHILEVLKSFIPRE